MSLDEQLALLAERVAAIEQQLARASNGAPRSPTRHNGVNTEERNQEIARRQAEWDAREARRNVIREFDDQEWREEMRRFSRGSTR